jgi:outer membrane protein
MTRKSRARILTAASIALLTSSADLIAQAPAKPPLPDAPIARLIAQSAIQSDTQPVIPAPSAVTGQSPAALASTQPSTSNPRLTRAEAEAMATKKNPRVTVARLLALAQHQVVRETRAAELPTGLASITAVDADIDSSISGV